MRGVVEGCGALSGTQVQVQPSSQLRVRAWGARRENDERGSLGFTLMEVLIVVAIIGILVAIAIPVFVGQQERAKAGTDESNITNGYDQVKSLMMLEKNKSTLPTAYVLMDDGTVEKLDSTHNASKEYKTKGTSTNIPDSKSPSKEGEANTVQIAGVQASWSAEQAVYYVLDANKEYVTAISDTISVNYNPDAPGETTPSSSTSNSQP